MTGSENINICLDAIISSITVNSAEYAMAHAEPEDYINPTNGLVYCGRCHTPKQCVIRNLRTGGDMTVNCICKCDVASSAKEARNKELAELAERKKNSRIPSSLLGAEFCVIDDVKKRKNGINYVVNFDKIGSSGLLLYGDVGTGKSYMAACIANALMEAKYSIRWLQTTQITEMCGFYSEEQYYEYLDNISKPDLLIVDDLGAERGTDYAAERVHALIDYRISAGKPLIITTNLELSEMRETSDIRKKRTYDRIFNACFPIAFRGTSFRQKQARDNFMMMNELLNENM